MTVWHAGLNKAANKMVDLRLAVYKVIVVDDKNKVFCDRVIKLIDCPLTTT